MFTGNLINQLIATVERAEERVCDEQAFMQNEKLTYFYTLAQQEISQLELAGVA
jgi:hypothetical protein